MKDLKKVFEPWNLVIVWGTILTLWFGYKYRQRFDLLDRYMKETAPAQIQSRVQAEMLQYSSELSNIQQELQDLKRDWKFEKELLEADKKFIMDSLELFIKHIEEKHEPTGLEKTSEVPIRD